ncbi:hypothetical protein [Borrelia miyamotoi]|uniref:hypothetical protein n=1 Tax=Borrelia miyamotoi TaxID=47466 RepID=UPI002180A3C8|nr:hypothetical protein [Borrelia miyamotoi]
MAIKPENIDNTILKDTAPISVIVLQKGYLSKFGPLEPMPAKDIPRVIKIPLLATIEKIGNTPISKYL